ncbi:sensor domain-containing diguanylate cyclase [Fusibacter bizertensis]
MAFENFNVEKLNKSDLEVIDRLISMPTILVNHNRVAYINDLFVETFGCNLDDLNLYKLESFINPIHIEGFKKHVRNALSGESFVEQSELCVRTAKAEIFWVEHKTRVVMYEGEPFILAHLMDINDKKYTQLHLSKLLLLRESMLKVTQSIVRSDGIAQLYKSILSSILGAINHAELGTVLLREGDQLKSVAQIGYDAKSMEVFSLAVSDSFYYRSLGKEHSQIVMINDLKIFGDYEKIRTVNGEEEYIKSTISAPVFINNVFFGLVNVDSTESNAFDEDDVKLMEFVRNNVEIAVSNQLLFEEKAFLSRYDSLTRLYNRHYFDEMFKHILERASRYNEKFNLVVFDLNDLKSVNDEHGHIAGDELLKYFSDSCKALIRKSDILARYGGDEFVGIFFNCTKERLRRRIDGHLKYLIDNPINIKDKAFVCSYSYGISAFGEEGMTLNELFRIADDRMYQNKIRYKLGFDFIEAFESGNVPVFDSLDLKKYKEEVL